MHKSGFVNIVGNPNVGKSTLMNALMKDRLSIITSKPQTTRHRILGILSGEDFQIVFSDSPGVIEDPRYELQNKMNSFAFSSFEDADVILFVVDLFESYEGQEKVIQLLKKTEAPKFFVINKVDLDKGGKVDAIIEKWKDLVDFDETFVISAKDKINIEELESAIVANLPEGPEYYPKDQLSDKPERFFVSEIIREKILEQFKQEIPYSCEVVVEEFKHTEAKSGPIIRMRAEIYVDRPTQKSIIIGKGGVSIKKLGTEARRNLEEFFEKKVFLELFVKVKENWRNTDKLLKHFGYDG